MTDFSIKMIFDAVAAAMGAAFYYLFGAWDALIIALVCFVAMDYLTGVAAAIVGKRLSSEVGFSGLLRKALIMVVVAVAAQLDKLLGQEVFRSMTCGFYIANEGLSILENTSAAGVPLPAKLMDALARLRKPAEEQAQDQDQDQDKDKDQKA